jgi:hypothetical protein
LAARKSGAATLARLRHNFADLLDTPLQEITPWLLEKFRAAELKRGKARSTLNRDVTALQAVMAKAVEWNILETHPLAKLKPFKLDSKGVTRYLSPEENSSCELLSPSVMLRVKQLVAAATPGAVLVGILNFPLWKHTPTGTISPRWFC